MANGGLSPAEAIAADETSFRMHVIMALAEIRTNCKYRCDAEAKRGRWLDYAGKMLLQALLTGAGATAIALLTLHLRG